MGSEKDRKCELVAGEEEQEDTLKRGKGMPWRVWETFDGSVALRNLTLFFPGAKSANDLQPTT